jgi:hypothetical protein
MTWSVPADSTMQPWVRSDTSDTRHLTNQILTSGAGWGPAEPSFWLCKPFDGAPATVGNGSMIAFDPKSWKEVDKFHSVALAHGGNSEGPPALRLQYGPDFYAAYVRDPDGNKIAAICRGFTTDK